MFDSSETARLLAFNFYEMIVDLGFILVNSDLMESNC